MDYVKLMMDANEARKAAVRVGDGMAKKAMAELASAAARQACYDAWEDEGFRERWEGTPVRYKRFSKAAFTWLPEGWHAHVDGCGQVCVYDFPEGEWGETACCFYAYRFTSWSFDGPGNVDDRVFAYCPDTDCVVRPLPSVADVAEAYAKAEAVRAEVQAELDAAVNAARERARGASLGLRSLYEAVKPRDVRF